MGVMCTRHPVCCWTAIYKFAAGSVRPTYVRTRVCMLNIIMTRYYGRGFHLSVHRGNFCMDAGLCGVQGLSAIWRLLVVSILEVTTSMLTASLKCVRANQVNHCTHISNVMLLFSSAHSLISMSSLVGGI